MPDREAEKAAKEAKEQQLKARIDTLENRTDAQSRAIADLKRELDRMRSEK